MLTRDEALKFLAEHGHEGSQLYHSLEAEAVLRGLAEKLGKPADEVELWGLTGLLHDLDYPATKETPERHALEAAEFLADRLPPLALDAIRRHNHLSGHAPETELDHALRCGETVTGLVAAAALVRPDKMHGMTPKSLKKKMKDKAFARNVDRDIIRECEKLGLDLAEFLQLSIAQIAAIADDVGLA